MSLTVLTSREVNADLGGAKKAAEAGPVIITDRGRPAHVILTYDDWRKLSAGRRTLAEALAQPNSADIEFEPDRLVFTPRDAGFGD